jgi:hypothetical protein
MDVPTLNEMVQHVETHQDLAEFMVALRQYLHDDPGDWENPTLDRYLDAMALGQARWKVFIVGGMKRCRRILLGKLLP